MVEKESDKIEYGFDSHSRISLPPGFRFKPTDEELIYIYLKNKLANPTSPLISRMSKFITDADIYIASPECLEAIYDVKFEGKNFVYFFTPRYEKGKRPDRTVGKDGKDGYWRAQGVYTEIKQGEQVIGKRMALTFYKGEERTNWIMHEFTLEGHVRRRTSLEDKKLNDYVLCRIYKNSKPENKTTGSTQSLGRADEIQSPNQLEANVPSPPHDASVGAVAFGSYKLKDNNYERGCASVDIEPVVGAALGNDEFNNVNNNYCYNEIDKNNNYGRGCAGVDIRPVAGAALGNDEFNNINNTVLSFRELQNAGGSTNEVELIVSLDQLEGNADSQKRRRFNYNEMNKNKNNNDTVLSFREVQNAQKRRSFKFINNKSMSITEMEEYLMYDDEVEPPN